MSRNLVGSDRLVCGHPSGASAAYRLDSRLVCGRIGDGEKVCPVLLRPLDKGIVNNHAVALAERDLVSRGLNLADVEPLQYVGKIAFDALTRIPLLLSALRKVLFLCLNKRIIIFCTYKVSTFFSLRNICIKHILFMLN